MESKSDFLDRIGPLRTGDCDGKSDEVFRTLLAAIQDGRLAVGEKLPSNSDLCDMFGMSRVSVRSALERLKGMGVLESKRGGGTCITGMQIEDRIDFGMLIAPDKVDRMNVFELRRIMEGEMAALAAARATTEEVDCMRETIERMQNATTQEEQRQYDVEFHYWIAQATHNPLILRIFEIMRPTYEYLIEGNVAVMGVMGASFHQQITTAIEIRDGKLAKQLMDEHLVNAIRATHDINMQ